MSDDTHRFQSTHTTRKRTNKTDQEIDEDDPGSSAGAVLNPVNSGHTSEEEQAAAGRVLGGGGSKNDQEKVKIAAKKIPKNDAAARRDEKQKNQ